MPLNKKIKTLLEQLRPLLDKFGERLGDFITYHPAEYHNYLDSAEAPFQAEILGCSGKLLAFIENIANDAIPAAGKHELAKQLPGIIATCQKDIQKFQSAPEVIDSEKELCENILTLIAEISDNIPSGIAKTNDIVNQNNSNKR
jgi:hypothetical protein